MKVLEWMKYFKKDVQITLKIFIENLVDELRSFLVNNINKIKQYHQCSWSNYSKVECREDQGYIVSFGVCEKKW